MDAPIAARSASRALRITGIATAAVALTTIFLVIGFPYDVLAGRLVHTFEQHSGNRVGLGEVSTGWVRWGPGLVARDVRVVRPDGQVHEFANIGARPALSLAWFGGNPALAIRVASPAGSADGTATFAPRSFAGTLEQVDLAQLAEVLGLGTSVEGRVDVEVDVTLTEDGPQGTLSFVARAGSVAHPSLPLAIPYEELTGDVALGGDQWLELRSLALDSPLASGTAKGTIGNAAQLANAPLALSIELTVKDAVRRPLSSQGVRVGRDGRVSLRVTGTVANPSVR